MQHSRSTAASAVGFGCYKVNSPWFKLFLYSLCGSGPPSLLLTRGTRLCRLPRMFEGTCDGLIRPPARRGVSRDE